MHTETTRQQRLKLDCAAAGSYVIGMCCFITTFCDIFKIIQKIHDDVTVQFILSHIPSGPVCYAHIRVSQVNVTQLTKLWS
jgi:hypothetical protein